MIAIEVILKYTNCIEGSTYEFKNNAEICMNRGQDNIILYIVETNNRNNKKCINDLPFMIFWEGENLSKM